MRALSLLSILALTACGDKDSGDTVPDLDHDGVNSATDCDDTNASVYPDAPELCDGLDNNCDAEVDNDPTDTKTFYADVDHDGYGNPANTKDACDLPTGYVENDDDCSDSDASYHPGAAELDCTDQNDYNCDGSTGYADADADGHPACQDCDDTRTNVHPGGTETCDDRDNDCNNLIDDNASDAPTFYADFDGDSFGSAVVTQAACDAPAGYVADNTDCDDLNAATYPGASETCDGKINNCGGNLPASEADADRDGIRTCQGDCNDGNASIRPGATELCDGADNDCDSSIDEDAANAPTWYRDADADTYGNPATTTRACAAPAGYVANFQDCNDAQASAYPGALERCSTSFDDDCDGTINEADATDAPSWHLDADSDGFGRAGGVLKACTVPDGYTASSSDCDDLDPATYPAAAEVCDGVLNNCESSLPANEADADHDGYMACEGDCNDASASIRPGAAETCDSTDRNCDGSATDGAVDGTRYYYDLDEDGYGDPDNTVWACAMPASTTNDHQDCHDDDETAFPGSTARETPLDGIDTDCDGNDFCTDLNCDGLPDIHVPSHRDGDYNVTQPFNILSGVSGWALASDSVNQFGTLGVEHADLNGDGYQDIVAASYHNGSTRNTTSFIYWGASDGHHQAARTALPTNGAHYPCIADLNNDGWEDVVFADHHNDSSYSTDSYVYWNRAGVFTDTDRKALPTTGATNCAVADLNNDGHRDVVFAQYTSGSSYSTNSIVYWGSASGPVTTTSTALPTVGAYSADIADVDGDGLKDIVFWSHYDGDHTSNNNIIYWNSPSGFSIASKATLEGFGPYRGLVADLDDDGAMDVVVPGYHNGTSYATNSYIYWGNGTRTYGNSNRTTLSATGILSALAEDINDDGHLDLLLLSHYDGNSYTDSSIFWGTPNGTFSNTNKLNLQNYQGNYGAAVRDLDHDGYKDVFLPGYHNDGWGNQSYSRVYWGSALGLSAAVYDQWNSRGAWDALVVGN